ncbi:hypothetical protein HZI73_25135 [Vallitalea pronyensis]|uniref:Uncharacterized protein n=1 Tax=Vallitalea pronyensis TaxID=1348613 RepID=A0A8J8MPK6_9FIRM|nr:hypothetical protein [Vallitalea pronyensis]QUI25381.1 hypothetical protein HZI73_25135 [Vallitalea pronyensis]
MKHYAIMEYMKVVNRLQDVYIKTEEAWKGVHKRRLDEGIISGWYLYKVHYAYEGARHNYVTINTYDDFSRLSNVYPRHMVAEADPEKGYDGFEDMTEDSRKKMFSELSKLIDSCGPIDKTLTNSKYLKVAFMTVDECHKDKYAAMENKVWKKAHQYLVDQGIQDWWALYELEFPHGTSVGYQYITVSAVSDFDKLQELDYWGAYKACYPDGDFDGDYAKTLALRQCERAELWELIDVL